MAKHDVVLFTGLVIALIWSILTPAFYNVINRSSGRKTFVKQLEYEVFKSQPTSITPSWWVHIIWEICMWFQPPWIFSTMVFVLMRDKKGDFLYKQTPTSAVILFILGSIFQMIRYFCFGHRLVVGSFVASIFGLAVCIASLAILTTRPRDWFLAAAGRTKRGNMYSVFITRCCAINFLGAYCTWTFLYLMFHFAAVLAYEVPKGYDSDAVAIGCLGVILLATFAYMLCDLCFFDPLNRFQLAPYAFLILGMAAVLGSPYCTDHSCVALAAIILMQAALGLIFKIIFLLLREVVDLKMVKKGTPQ